MDQTPSQPSGASPSDVGARLAKARLARELSLDDIAARTRIPLRHLHAIEQGEHAGLPAAPYSVGFVRSYAKLLELDVDALARDFRAEIGARTIDRYAHESFEPADPARVPSSLLAFVALAIALLLATGYAVWRSGVLSGESAEERSRLAAGVPDTAPAPPPSPVAPAPQSVAPPAAPPPAAAPAAASGPVTLTATDTGWLRVSERGGNRLYEKLMNPGESWQLPATANDPVIATGRPQALRITVGATVIPPLGPPEHRVSGISLRPDALLARPTAYAPAAPPSASPMPPADGNAIQPPIG